MGCWKRWLNGYEIGAALGLLFIPYWTVGYESQMVSMARYVVVIAPLYLVAGRLLAKLPPLVGGCGLGACRVRSGAETPDWFTGARRACAWPRYPLR